MLRPAQMFGNTHPIADDFFGSRSIPALMMILRLRGSGRSMRRPTISFCGSRFEGPAVSFVFLGAMTRVLSREMLESAPCASLR
jgi:hypothetical protein